MRRDYAARLARLEKAAGKGACPFCRLSRRHTWRDPAKPPPEPKDPALVAASRCEGCGAPMKYDLSGYPEGVRGMLRLFCAATPEATYTDPRAWASRYWIALFREARRRQREVLREMRKSSAPAQSPEQKRSDYMRRQEARERERELAGDADLKLYNDCLAEAQKFRARRDTRLRRKCGDYPFPEVGARLRAVQGADCERLYKGEPDEHLVPFSPMFECSNSGRRRGRGRLARSRRPSPARL